METFETLSQAITSLQQRGYVNDFNLHPEWIECPPLSKRLMNRMNFMWMKFTV